MKLKIISAYTELRYLNKSCVYSVAQINWWLLKYGDLYKSVVNSQNLLCDNCLKLKAENLPIDCLLKPIYCNKKPEHQKFIKFHDELDIVTELHKLEEMCNMAYDEYMILNCIDEDLRGWVIKHYDIYYQISGHFYTFLEFNPKGIKSLHIAEAPDKSFGVAIKEEDFKNSLRFYDVYDDLYHIQKLYPEKIKEWDEFFSKIELPKDEL